MSGPLRVLQVAPLWFPTGPDGPGGIETFLAALARALADAGCEVTLLAPAGSDGGVPVVEVLGAGLFAAMRAGAAWDQVPYEQHALLTAGRMRGEFDLVHAHLGPAGFVLSAGGPALHTLHGQVTRDLEWLVAREPELWLTTPAEPQAARLRAAGARHCAAVPNGLDTTRFPAGAGGGPLVFLGRMERQKGPDLALAAATALDRDLVLAGPVADEDFFAAAIAPQLSERAQYHGVLAHADKVTLLAQASCVVMPSRWEEPFGMVAAEAAACGTPVAALARGALPDVVEQGLTGWCAQDEAGLAAAVARALTLDRGAIRSRALERFGIEPVARRFVAQYEAMLG